MDLLNALIQSMKEITDVLYKEYLDEREYIKENERLKCIL